MRKLCAVGAIVGLCLGLSASAAFAHAGLDPDEAGPGTIIALTLHLEDEKSGASINMVELLFPEDASIAVVDIGAVDGWTAQAKSDEVDGDPVTQVTWTGGPAEGELSLPITIGPLPGETGRLQFKVLQTYTNGETDRWIAEWPEGAPEPENPGPVLDVVAGGPGTSVASTTTTAPTSPSTDATTTTAAATDTTAAPADESDDDDSNLAVPIVIGAIVVAVLAGGAYLWSRRRRPSGDGTAT